MIALGLSLDGIVILESQDLYVHILVETEFTFKMKVYVMIITI